MRTFRNTVAQQIPAGTTAPTRAVNVDATIEQVVAMAAKHDAVISAIEPLQPTGTRVVFQNADGAASVSRAFGTRVIKGEVKRLAWGQR